MHIQTMVQSKYQIRHLLITQELFYLTQVKIRNFGASPISVTSSSPTKLIMGAVDVPYLLWHG